MEIIKWSDALSVGVKEMDEQHQKLIAMINKLIVEQKTLTDETTIAELLTEMTDYAMVHFRAEEYLMAEYGYEEKDRQVLQHQEFIESTKTLYSKSDIGPNILSKALLDYLRKWLVNHILKEDMRYKSFFEQKGVQ